MTEKAATDSAVEAMPKPRMLSSQQQIWGKPVLSHGYTAIPTILIQAQTRVGLSAMQFNIVVQLLNFWHDPARPPFPSKAELAQRIGCKPKTIQTNITALVKMKLVEREMRRTASGDWNSNVYRLAGLVDRVRELETDFASVKAEQKAAQRRIGTPRRRPVR